MDKASITIDRHTPDIPESRWFGVSPTMERIYTQIKNRLILPFSKIDEITRWNKVQGNVFPKGPRRVITDADYREVEEHLRQSVEAGLLSNWHRFYLKDRGISDSEIKFYKMVSTAGLVNAMNPDRVENLTLCVPKRFSAHVDRRCIDGISIPHFHEGYLIGFVTRVLFKPNVKYACSVPNRLTWGADFNHKNRIWIVEGVFDAIAMRRLEYNVMATGDSQPNYYRTLQASKFEQIHILLDNDYAGYLGAVKTYLILTEMLMVERERIKIFALRDYKDPEEAILKTGDIQTDLLLFREALDKVQELGEKLKPEDFIL